MKYRSQRPKDIMNKIREILMNDWDPIGVRDIPEAHDEYDSYIGQVYRFIAGSRSENELVDFLYHTEQETMGLPGSSKDDLRLIANKLLSLDVKM